MNASRTWFDGHLDLTYIADHGRDLTRVTMHSGGGLPEESASVSFPTLCAAGVQAAVSTIFVRRRVRADAGQGVGAVEGPYCYDTPEEAYTAAVRQVEMHHAWEQTGWLQASGNMTAGIEGLRTILAIEGAACLRSTADLDFFHAAGVREVSLAWAEGSIWAGGDQSGGDVTPAGLDLIDRLDALGIVHDVSHLSEAAFWTLMARAKGKCIASHSNCRALLPGAKYPERHLSDEQIRAIADADGLIGINLFARFLVQPDQLKLRRATIADVVRHLEHMAQVAGRRDFLALGSDMDSGFGPELLPVDLQSPMHLERLAEALSAAGWSDGEISRFRWENWAELFGDSPPQKRE
jgi:membrane dipeptidase